MKYYEQLSQDSYNRRDVTLYCGLFICAYCFTGTKSSAALILNWVKLWLCLLVEVSIWERVGMGRTSSPIRSLGVMKSITTSISTLWFPGSSILPRWDSIPHNNHPSNCNSTFWKPMAFRCGAGEIGRMSVLDWFIQKRTWGKCLKVRGLFG